MGIVLVGEPGTRRTEYFLRAAGELHKPVRFVDWQAAGGMEFHGDVVKLDPPSYKSSDLFQMKDHLASFHQQMKGFGKAGGIFLNPPCEILRLLDKRQCKEILMENQVSVTEMLEEKIENTEQLMEAMRRHRIYSVFIKPVYSSGAAGVTAFRLAPGRGRMTAYTSCILQREELVNTKKLRRMENAQEIFRLLDAVLSLGAVVERWHPKASFRGKSYDLRVVWQFGRCEFVVARCSSGPVTNLHLNNSPLAFSDLGLSEKVACEINALCEKAMSCFPELRMAGIDVLLERGSLKPKIIEMNGQGDLMYQDIFHENRIYRRQVEWMAQRAADRDG